LINRLPTGFQQCKNLNAKLLLPAGSSNLILPLCCCTCKARPGWATPACALKLPFVCILGDIPFIQKLNNNKNNTTQNNTEKSVLFLSVSSLKEALPAPFIFMVKLVN
jgi:hypothetical protein